jgi:hypothetical protein
MKRNTRLITLLSIVILIAFTISLLPNGSTPPSPTVRADPADAWWNSSWGYRKSFNVSGQASTESTYTIEIIVYRASGTDSGNVVYVDTDKMQSDFDDLRFANDDATPTECSYWIEWKNTTMARTWVELDSITASATDTFYMYYDNSGASAASDGDAAFVMFDDFDTDNYSYTGTSVNVDEGGDERVEWTSSLSYGDGEDVRSAVTGEYALEGYLQFTSMSGFSAMRMMFADTTTGAWGLPAGWDAIGFQMDYNMNFHMYIVENGAADTNGTSSWSTSTTYYVRITFDNGVAHAYLFSDYWDSVVIEREVTGVSFSNSPDTIIFQSRDRAGCVGWFDDWRMRRWVDEDPQASNWGDEEIEGFAPTIIDDNTSATTNNTCIQHYDFDAVVPEHTISTYDSPLIYVYWTDPDGFSDLNYLEVSIYDDARGTEYWKIRYTQSTNTWSEQSDVGGSYYLDGSDGYSSSSNTHWVYVRWGICWNATNLSNIDMKVYVLDDIALSDTEWIEEAGRDGSNPHAQELDIETRIDFDTHTITDASGTPDRGGLSETITATYDLGYYGHTSIIPDPAEVDLWITSTIGNWEVDSDADWSGTTSVTSDATVGLDTYTFKVVLEGAGSGATDESHTTHTDTYIADKVSVTITAPTIVHRAIGDNMTGVLWSAVYDYGGSYDGSVTWNVADWSPSIATTANVIISSVSGGTHGVTSFSYSGGFTCYWETITLSDATFWTKQSDTTVFAHITLSALQWSESLQSVQDGAYVGMFDNTTDEGGWDFFANVTTASQTATRVQVYENNQQYVMWQFSVTYISGSYYFLNYTFYSTNDTVPIINTLFIEVFSMEIDDYYINIYWESNWHNATCFIFKDDVYQSNVTTEGFAQIGKPTTAGTYEYTFVFNATDGALSGDQNPAGIDGAYWKIRIRNVDISVTAYIVLTDAAGQVIDQRRFEIYVAGDLLNPYEPFYVCTTDTANVTIYDEYWDEVIFTNVTHPMSSRVQISISCHWMIIINQQDEGVYIDVTHNSITHRFHVADRLQLLIFDGVYTAYAYRERDGNGVQILTTDGDWDSHEEVTVSSEDYLIVTRATADPQIPIPNFTPMMMVLTMIAVAVVFVGLIIIIMAFRGRRGQQRLERGVFSPPTGVQARPLGQQPSKTKRDTRTPEEKEYDNHTDEWDRLRDEAE